MRFLRLYSAFIKQFFKSLMEYKMDFMLGLIGLSIVQIGTFFALFAVFTQIKTIAGYTFHEVLLLFGYAQIIRGIDHIYNDNIWFVATFYIREGRFYQFLIRPIDPLLHIVMERICADGFGEFLLGLVIFLYAKSSLGLSFGLAGWALFLLFTVCGLTIYFAIKLAFASIALWTVTSNEIMTLTYEVNSYTHYPLEIYKNKFIQFFITFVLPFAVVSYFPMIYYLRDGAQIGAYFGIAGFDKNWLILFIPAVALLTLGISLIIWRAGLKRFQATGT
jgi:ABC-2 type transport system permease protein